MRDVADTVVAVLITAVMAVWLLGCLIFTRNEERNY